MPRPVVTFLSDFGSSDPFVGICHGVIVRTCADAEVIHLAHGIDPQSVEWGTDVATRLILELCGGEASEITKSGVMPEWQRSYGLRAERVKGRRIGRVGMAPSVRQPAAAHDSMALGFAGSADSTPLRTLGWPRRLGQLLAGLR